MSADLQHPINAVHVINSLTPSHGGPSVSVPALAAALATLGVGVTLRCLEGRPSAPSNETSYKLHAPDRGLLSPLSRSSKDLMQALLRDANAGAVLHAHGLWLMPNVYPAWAKTKSRGASTLVHSIRGMLSEKALRISSWKKAPFWFAYQRAALRCADCLHATAASEYDDIRRAGLTNPVAVIPNGVDIPALAWGKPGDEGERIVLSLGRVHPIKGLDRLIRAWTRLETQFPNWRLRIAGPAHDNYDVTLRSLISSLGAKRVTIDGPLYGDDKRRAYARSDLFVLASHSENFGLALAEALAAGLPAIATKGAPWQGLNTLACGWWVDDNTDALGSALSEAIALPPSQRVVMGARGRQWMKEAFSWATIACQFRDLYRWLLLGGSPPATVVLD